MAKSAMRKDYGRVPQPRGVPRSRFNMSERNLTTTRAGYITPFYWKPVYPGEIWKATTDLFARLSNPLEYPLMDNMTITVHWWFDSFRNQWDNFRKFFGERNNPGDSIDYTTPKLDANNAYDMTGPSTTNFLLDRLGINRIASVDLSEINAFPCRMYNRVYNQGYRDANLQDQVTESTGDGPDTVGDYQILYRGKRFDYFTNNLPSPQRGESVTIGGEVATAANVNTLVGVYSDGASGYRQLYEGANTEVQVKNSATSAETNKLYPNTTINELRNSVALQQFFETDNRYGNRFGEIVFGHFGVEFQDAKYAPVYLGGGRGSLYVSPVLNTGQDDVSNEIGDLHAIGTGHVGGAGFTYAVDEPGLIMGVFIIDADLSYQQGIERFWFNDTRYDFFWPEFVGIGDQPTYNREIYYQNNASDELVFGYNPRYEELRTGINRVTGEFRSDASASLDVWHLAEDYASLPTLGDTWIKAFPPMSRVLKDGTPDHLICDIFTRATAVRQLPMYGTPGVLRL